MSGTFYYATTSATSIPSRKAPAFSISCICKDTIHLFLLANFPFENPISVPILCLPPSHDRDWPYHPAATTTSPPGPPPSTMMIINKGTSPFLQCQRRNTASRPAWRLIFQNMAMSEGLGLACEGRRKKTAARGVICSPFVLVVVRPLWEDMIYVHAALYMQRCTCLPTRAPAKSVKQISTRLPWLIYSRSRALTLPGVLLYKSPFLFHSFGVYTGAPLSFLYLSCAQSLEPTTVMPLYNTAT